MKISQNCFQALPNESVRPSLSNAAEEGQLGLMPIPLHFRLNSFSSPADTTRPQTSSKPSQSAETTGSTSGSGGAHTAITSPHLHSRSSSVPAASPDILLPIFPKSSQFVDENGIDHNRIIICHMLNEICSVIAITVIAAPSSQPRWNIYQKPHIDFCRY